MKRNILFISVFLVNLTLVAQSGDPKKRPLSRKERHDIAISKMDTIVPAGRNELYLNIAPVLCTMLGAYPDNEMRYSLFYKRVLNKPNHALRVGLLYRPQVSYYYNNFPNQGDWFFFQSDSTRIRNSFDNGRKKPIQLNVGYEWRTKGNHRWSAFGGIDAMGGVFFRQYVLRDIAEQMDSLHNWLPDPTDPSTTVLQSENTTNFFIGINPTGGFRYAFNAHWLASLSTGMDLYATKETVYRRDGLGTGLIKYDSFNYTFDMSGLFNEFSIVYRF